MEEKNPVKWLLFKGVFNDSGLPLFRNQTELARDVSEELGDTSQQATNSARSFIGAIICGKRKCSPKFYDAIVNIVEQQIEDKMILDRWKNDFHRALDNQLDRYKSYRVDDQVLDGVFQRYCKAQHVIAASSDPIECKGTGLSERIIDSFYQSVKVLSGGTKFRSNMRYEFYYNSEATARVAWTAFLRRLQQKGFRPSQIRDVLMLLNQGTLEVMYSPEDIFYMPPMVIYDLHETRRVGFHFYYDSNLGTTGIAHSRLTDNVLSHWKSAVYDHLRMDGLRLDLLELLEELLENDVLTI